MGDDVASVKFVGFARGLFAEDDGGFERSGAAGSAVGNEMKIGEAAGLAAGVGAGGGLRAGQDGSALFGKVGLYLLDFEGGLGEGAEFGDWHGVAKEQEVFVFGRGAVKRGGQHGERTGGGQGDVLNPIVGLRV